MGFGDQWTKLILGLLVCNLYSQTSARNLNGGHTEEPPAIEKLLKGAVKESNGASFFHNLKQGQMKTEYDILLTVDEYKALMTSRKGPEKRATAISTHLVDRWTDNKVNYEIVSDFSDDDMDTILLAMKEWSDHTCVKFEENQAPNRVQIQDDASGCYSMLGMQGGIQPLGLSRLYCMQNRIVLHELGHALGLLHEHSNPYRDDYVKILWQHIPADFLGQFAKASIDWVEDYDIPYDYLSIMHYSSTLGNENGQVTMQALDPYYTDRMGHVTTLSFLDIKTVNLMYPCFGNDGDCTKQHSECPGEGFVGKDCTCWCEGDDHPVKHCDPNDDIEQGRLELRCMDHFPYTCQLFNHYCFNPSTQDAMNIYCAKTCNTCEA